MLTISFKEIYTAWLQCKRRKGKSPQAQYYAVNLLDNLFNTLYDLQQQRWYPKPPICFVIHYPKAREVYAAQFSDRVVHHWLVPQLEQCYQGYFINDVYSNIKGKGTHSAVKRLQKFMRSLSDQHSQAYFLQLDIANFFNSIDKTVLFQLLQRRLKQQVKKGDITVEKAQNLRWVSHHLLKQDAGRCAKHCGSNDEWVKIPPHKRLKNAGVHKGLPIGNLSSQFFANVYLNELDQFVKHQLKCRHYLRYVDDFILLHPRKEQLMQWHKAIEQFLQQQLFLALRPEIILHPLQHGSNFLGYIVRPYYCLVRRRVVGQLVQRLTQFQAQHVKGNQSNGWCISLPAVAREQLRAVLASYLGHFKHAKHYKLLVRIWQRFLWLALLFNQRECHLTPAWKPIYVSSFFSQQVYFQSSFLNALVRLQKGYQMLSLYPKVSKNKDSKTLLLAWHSNSDSSKNQYFIAAEDYIRAQVNHLVVKQEGYFPGGLRERCVQQLFINPGVYLCAQ